MPSDGQEATVWNVSGRYGAGDGFYGRGQVGTSFRLPSSLTMDPGAVEAILTASATPTACPATEPYVYPATGAQYTATCTGDPGSNGFYGAGIVNAGRAIDPVNRPEGLR